MRVHATDQLFGLEAFSRPIRTDQESEAGVTTDAEPAAVEGRSPADDEITGDLIREPGGAVEDAPDRTGDIAGVPVAAQVERSRPLTGSMERTGSIEATGSELTFRSLLSRRIVLSLVFFMLASTVAMSLFTLVMKTRKKAVSYELAHQTRLFKRMSKHRAIYELEYAYLRASSPIQEEFSRQGWREITPHDLTYIPMKKSESVVRGGPAW